MEYVRNLESSRDWLREEAECNLQRVTDGDGYGIVDGVMRWDSNGNVVPSEWVDLAMHADLPVVRAKCDEARDEEARIAIENYRRNMADRSAEEIAEQRFEARAAHGPGVKMVNIFTGERYVT